MKAYLFNHDGAFLRAYEVDPIASWIVKAFMRNPEFNIICICAGSMEEAMALLRKYCV